jgi:hypothetical protein
MYGERQDSNHQASASKCIVGIEGKNYEWTITKIREKSNNCEFHAKINPYETIITKYAMCQVMTGCQL